MYLQHTHYVRWYFIVIRIMRLSSPPHPHPTSAKKRAETVQNTQCNNKHQTFFAQQYSIITRQKLEFDHGV